ncbi:hypothetical protein ACLGL1_00505 [Peptococcus simiae]|uniref:hypothetical protein n=1 Tax=Peptococcus simiae TaxID=1643805 RepID=UPI0039815C42
MLNNTLIQLLLVFGLTWLANLGLVHLTLSRQRLAEPVMAEGWAIGLAGLPALWAVALAIRLDDPVFFFWSLAAGALLLMMALDDWAFRSVETIDLRLYAGLVLIHFFLFDRPILASRLVISLVMAAICLAILRLYPQGFGKGDAWVITLSAFLCGLGFYPRVFLVGLSLALVQALLDSLWVGALSRRPIPLVTWLNIGLALSLVIWPQGLDQWL